MLYVFILLQGNVNKTIFIKLQNVKEHITSLASLMFMCLEENIILHISESCVSSDSSREVFSSWDHVFLHCATAIFKLLVGKDVHGGE